MARNRVQNGDFFTKRLAILPKLRLAPVWGMQTTGWNESAHARCGISDGENPPGMLLSRGRRVCLWLPYSSCAIGNGLDGAC